MFDDEHRFAFYKNRFDQMIFRISSSQESLGGLGMGGGWGGGASPGLPRGVAAAASAVSIASMHQQKKRGIKSSLGRFFSKKEKAGLPVTQDLPIFF